MAAFATLYQKDETPNPFDNVEQIGVIEQQQPIASELPVVQPFDSDLLIERLGQVIADSNAQIKQDVTALARKVDGLEAKQKESIAMGGAGFQLPEMSSQCDCKCDGKCLNESDVRKIVRDEFDKQVLAESQYPRAYNSTAAAQMSLSRGVVMQSAQSNPIAAQQSGPVYQNVRKCIRDRMGRVVRCYTERVRIQ